MTQVRIYDDIGYMVHSFTSDTPHSDAARLMGAEHTYTADQFDTLKEEVQAEYEEHLNDHTSLRILSEDW